MAKNDRASGMKSAYELALERMEALGVERPSETALSDATKQAIAEARKVTEAKLAELEILHRDKLAKTEEYTKRQEQEEYFRMERERITAEGEAKVERLRRG
jgi:hypothetical protein